MALAKDRAWELGPRRHALSFVGGSRFYSTPVFGMILCTLADARRAQSPAAVSELALPCCTKRREEDKPSYWILRFG